MAKAKRKHQATPLGPEVKTCAEPGCTWKLGPTDDACAIHPKGQIRITRTTPSGGKVSTLR